MRDYGLRFIGNIRVCVLKSSELPRVNEALHSSLVKLFPGRSVLYTGYHIFSCVAPQAIINWTRDNCLDKKESTNRLYKCLTGFCLKIQRNTKSNDI